MPIKIKNCYLFETSTAIQISNIINLLLAHPNQRIAIGEIDKQQKSIEENFKLFLEE